MPVRNADLAAVFEEIGDRLEIEGANPFRIRAYRNAARQLQAMGVPVADMVAKGEDLSELPSIGEDLAAKIKEIVETGKCQAFAKLRKKMPPTVTQLLQIPGLGPKRVRTLYQELDVQTLEQLGRAALDHRIREVPGFGVKTEAAILRATGKHLDTPARFKLAIAAQYAEPLKGYLEEGPGVVAVVVAGSYRRCRETVGDIDILASASDAQRMMDHFVAYDEVRKIVAKGGTRSTVILKCGLQVDLRVVGVESFGAALQYFTGSKAHNIEIRRRAQERKLKISEYGVFAGQRRISSDTEESVYRAVGLPFIPAELRESRGEIEAAQAGKLPVLVELRDLKGDLHAHTKATDGHHSLKEMAQATASRGLEYLAITEHSRRLTVAHELDPQRLRRQIAEIDRLNTEFGDVTVLKGVEVSILETGCLDLPDEVLGELDLVVGAVHSQFTLSRTKQTERILRAMDHPHFTILAHPTGRLLDGREPYDVDILRIIRHARERGCYLELNAQPNRLDLLDIHCQLARDEGVLVAISSDAHRVQDFDNLLYGVGQARRGWLSKDDVLNTRSLTDLRPLLKRTT
ncbi:MAG: DNA polymerase/3'-5' exonuclease PolX [Gammaproteobacteria bacterium]